MPRTNPFPLVRFRQRAGGLRGLAGLDPTTIQTYAANAGFTGADLATAVAVAMAESQGNPQAYNPEKAAGTPAGKGSYGLWQIYLNAHPEFAGQNLYDPQTNANAAFAVYQAAGGFRPWSTYTNGQYQAFMTLPQGDATASSSVPSPSPAPLTIDASTGLPIDDSTPTPIVAAGVLGGSPDILVLTLVGLGVYVLADILEL
jgi:hypothetical protein